MELRAFQATGTDLPITFWRTSSGQEVDFILGTGLGIEIKGKTGFMRATSVLCRL